jgi:alpha-L-fucosidase
MGNGGHGPLPAGGDPNSPYWCPAEVDSTLQAGDAWFFVQGAPLTSLRALVQSYHESLGRNANWVLGLSPGPDGLLAPTHHALCARLGDWLRACFGKPAAAGAMAAGHARLDLLLPPSPDGVLLNRVRLREDQSRGQRVRSYNLTATLAGPAGATVALAGGWSIGAGKVDLFEAVRATSLQLVTDVAPTALHLEAFFCLDPE